MDLSNTENIIILNWNKICRICLNDGSALCQIINLDKHFKMTYKDMINSCTGFNMSSGDDFPQLICSFCIQQLSTALEFKTKCHSSQNMLTKLLPRKNDSSNEIKSEEIEVESNPLDFFHEQTDNEDVFEIEVKNESVEITNIRNKNISKCSPKECNSDNNCNKQLKKDKTCLVKSDLEAFPTKFGSSNSKHVCLICDGSYSTYGQLLKHRKSHTNTCWKCSIVLNSQKEHDEHMKTHNRTDCPECGRVFDNRERYTQHMYTHTRNKNLCMVCGKNYKSISSLSAHIRIHTGEKRYNCTHCDMKFLHWSNRRDHIRSVHTKEKPHECNFCKMRFTASGYLIKHLRVHTGERPYPCSLCDKKFTTSASRRMHMYKHTGERKVICQICNKGFTKNYNLKIHMVTHTGEKNHLCLVCGKAFAQAQVLRTHMKTHTEREVCKQGIDN